MNRWSLSSIVVSALLLAGCSKSPTAPAPVPGLHGTVTSGGVAVAGARIYVLPELVDVTGPALAAGARGAGRHDIGPVPEVPPRDTLEVFPNPASGVCRAMIAVVQEDRGVLEVLDRQGRPVRLLFDRTVAAGLYSVAWDARDDTGAVIPGGLYVMRWRTGFAGTPKTFETPLALLMGSALGPAERLTDAHGAFELPYVSGMPGDTIAVTDANGLRIGTQRFTDRVTIRVAIGDDTRGTLHVVERSVPMADIRRGTSLTFVLP